MKSSLRKFSLGTSLAVLFICLVLITGSTFSLFTSKVDTNIGVTSATVALTAEISGDSLTLLSKGVEQETNFENGGTATFNDSATVLTLTNITPGDKAVFDIVVTNKSNVDIQYRISWTIDGALAGALEIAADETPIESGASEWTKWAPGENEGEKTISVSVELPLNVKDDYEEKSANIAFVVEAVQGNADIPDEWDGTADISWYNETDTEFTLTSAEQFAGFAELVSEDANNFEGKTIVLDTSIDLSGEVFAPIGTTGEYDSRGRLVTEPFKGTFDGNGNTIANLNQNGWAFGYEWGQYGSIGLFSELEGATVKNVVLEGFDCAIEGGDIAFVAGSATGDCIFENITINSGSIGTYNNGIGGIIGWSGEGTYNFKDITLGEDVVIGGLWGSFDSSAGGIVGQAEPGATYNFENVNVACRLDVFNDCTASYDYYNYRMCGMLIGRLEETTTIDGINYPDTSKYNITCTNVTVTYGEWANYHYCRAEGARAIRVEAGYAYDGIASDYDHSVCTLHHMELIPFDQIFGGDQYGVKGLASYDGVTVIYNNK